MDYFQGVVYDYLQQRGMFIKAECPIQVEPGKFPPKGTSWICDAIAVNFKRRTIYLCEVSYAKTLYALARRLQAWSKEWPRLCDAIVRDYSIPDSDSWRVQPWVFVPVGLRKQLKRRLSETVKVSSHAGKVPMPAPKVTFLESVVPWRGKTRERNGRRDGA